VRYAVAAAAAGGEVRSVPGPAGAPYRHDLDGMLAAIDSRTRIVVVVNPNNPTGSMIDRPDWEAFLGRVPESVLVILDEAYFEFVEDSDYPDGTRYLDGPRPLLVFRTFSKCHSLAGLRVGYGFGPPELLEYLDRARLPFNVSVVAQAAALAALADTTGHIEKTRALARSEVAFLDEGLAARGWKTEPSLANFVFAEAPVPGLELTERLMRRGFILRPLISFGMSDRFFRVSHGTREQNERFLAALDEVTADVSSR
jgi:histidinol-phosphate aminotransferase